jgi:hypothetical protein
MTQAVFTVGEAVGEGWRLFKERAGFWLGVAAVVLGAQVLLQLIGDLLFDDGLLRFGWSILSNVVMIWLGFRLVSIALESIDGKQPAIAELWSGELGPLFVRYLIASILYGIALAIGFALLVVPGIYLIVRFGFWPFVMVDRGTDVVDTFKVASHLTEGRRWDVLLLLIALTLILLAGTLALFVGLLVAMPVAGLAATFVYRRLNAVLPAGDVTIAPRAGGGTGF